LEVGCKKPDLVALRFHQDVRQDQDGVLPLHDALKKLQFSQEVVLSDDKFHGWADLEKGATLSLTPHLVAIGRTSRDLVLERRESREKLYRKGESVEKLFVSISPSKSTIYLVEKTCSKSGDRGS